MAEAELKPLNWTPSPDIGYTVTRRPDGGMNLVFSDTSDETLDKVSNIFLEYHDWINGESSSELKQYLEKKGFKVEKFPNNKIKELGFLWCVKM